MSAHDPTAGAGLSADDYWPVFECQECGVRACDDVADALLGWSRDEDGELSFCADCTSGYLGPPSPTISRRWHEGAVRYAEFKALLHEHREDALTCYDHPEHYCCVCGEHMALGYREHLAAVLGRREAAAAEQARAEVVAKVRALAADLTDEEAATIDYSMSEHMYRHQISNNVGGMSCNVHCRTQGLAAAVNGVLSDRRAALSDPAAPEAEGGEPA